MTQNWLVAIDETDVASYAFHYAVSKLNKDLDHLYLINVHDEPSIIYGGYTTPEVLSSLVEVQDKKSKKILVHYGHKSKEMGVKNFTLMKGSSSHAGELICRAVKQYHINNVVTGRRPLNSVQRFFVGSTSQYIVENAECNVVVVKQPGGAPEEHTDKEKVIQLEEEERIRRIEEEHKREVEQKKESEVALLKAHEIEENERARRLKEDQGQIHLYSFHNELKQKVH
eukprot:TRINITY_DN16220_c0_g1_i1.p1 TRINITY_DN16220_c0_g1~~TRINITY_DN16220_c0_g1_i1.p1  ORF type:complete len:227 (-),score=29.62 TRINITY_DN16220_c0_g1_i1:160-840(-)